MSVSVPGRMGTKQLTTELRKLANEAVTIDDAGVAVTRHEQLAAMIWRQALGWIEKVRDDSGNLIEKYHPPLQWCQQFLWERLEGKAAVAAVEDTGGIKAADKVRELARDRLNKMALVKSGPPKPKAPHA